MQFSSILLALAASALTIAHPVLDARDGVEMLLERASENINPNAITGTKCTNPSANIVFHDANVALLAICGGIAGKIEQCRGNPTSSSGASGTAIFRLNAVTAGATIVISKGRWEGCIRAARAVCPTGEFTTTCIGGASKGNVALSLSKQ